MTKPENRVDSLVEEIYAAVAARRMSRRQVAELSGVHVNTLKRFTHPDWNPAFSTLHKITAVLLTGDGPIQPDSGKKPLTRNGITRHRSVGRVNRSLAH